jgi:L-alanine-DL-glutamate epimerase-like enolase superfamily enzyme
MRITSITSVPYVYQLRRFIGDVNLPAGADQGFDAAVFVRTDEDVTGMSVAPAAAAFAIGRLEGLLLGMDPRSVRACFDKMLAMAFKAGNSGPVSAGISAIDRALWDLRAKINGVPLWKELGAADNRVPVYASGLDTPLSDEELHAFYAGMAARGVSVGKLKVGRSPDDDLRRLGVLVDALGSAGGRPQVIIDANEYWSPKQAIQRITALEREYDFVWVEEPVRRWDYDGLRRVSEGIRAPVATGENINALNEYVPLLTQQAVDVVQISSHTTGITGARAVAELAEAFARPVTMGNDPGRGMAHLAAALAHHTVMEVFDVGRDAALVNPPPIRDGCVVLNEDPGSGVVFDLDYLESHRADRLPGRSLAGSYVRAPDAGLVGVHEVGVHEEVSRHGSS